ncbi:MAG: hypothetical protein FWF81_00310 [Defluviitaleaceae bacterium]|nr:hypothetical protein [Defluviitaleaceae bacterium]
MAGALLMEISQDEHQRAKNRSRRMFEHDKFHNEASAEECGERHGENRGILGCKLWRVEITPLIAC